MDELLKLQRNNENLESNTSNDQSIISKIAKTALMYSITNSALSRTRFKDSKFKNILSLTTAISANIFQDNTDEDTFRTITAGALFVGGTKLAKNIINDNGYEITNFLKKIDDKNISLREKIFEFNQKRKENKAGKYNFENKEEYYDFLFNTKEKSIAGKMMENNNYNSFINRNIANNNKLNDVINNYFDKYNQIQKRGGFGFFDRTLKNLKIEDGKVLYNSEQIFKSRGDFDVVSVFANNFKNQINNYNKINKEFDDDFFNYLKSNRPEEKELIEKFQEFYNNKTSLSNTDVSLEDLMLDSKEFRNSFFQNIKTIGIKEDTAYNLFKNLKVKDMAKDKTGKIYDSSILDYENLALDFAQMIDKTIRPPFSFIPGELYNFSVIPFDIKSAILKKEQSEFKIIKTNIDYDDAIFQLEKQKKLIQSNQIGRLSILPVNKIDVINNKQTILNNIDNKIEQLKYESDFINRNTDFFDDTVKQKLNFSIDFENSFEIKQSKNKKINSFIYKDKLYKKLKDEKTWKEEKGKFDYTYSKMFKENQTSKYNASRANEFGDYGQFKESDNDNQLNNIIKKKLNNMKDKNGKLFNEELNDSFNNLKNIRNDLLNKVSNQNNISTEELEKNFFNLKYKLNKTKEYNQLNRFFNLDKIYINGELNKTNSSNIFQLLEKNKLYTNISNANETVKEDYIKTILNTKEFKIDNIINKNNKYFNETYLKENYYKSLFPSKRGTIIRKTESIRDIFSNKQHEIGTLENAYMNNFFNKFEDALSYLGIKKMNPHNNNSTGEHLKNVMVNRILPFLGIVYGVKALDGLVDSLIPDNTILGNGGVTGLVAKSYAMTRLGFQVLAENVGIKGATQYLINHSFGFLEVTDLNLSTQEMYEQYFKGKETPIRRNRYWFSSGRNGFEGGDIKEYRQSLIYKLQNRNSLFYKNKWERFYREDFLPTKILSRIKDPYLEERRLYEKGLPLDKSEQLFRDVPIFGELLSSTLGQLIKPTIYYNNAQEINPLARIIDSALNDIKSFGGYQGYVLSKTSDLFFGGKDITEVLNNKGFETRELASVDRLTSVSHSFNNLELGGMFGLTEPFRRLIPDGIKQTKSIMKNNLPDWYTNNLNKNNLEILDTDYNPTNYNNTSLLDKLRILANTNPNSTNYYNYKNIAINNINKGIYNNNEIQNIYESISIADNLINDNYTRDDLYISNQKFKTKTIQIDNVISNNEIISNGKRIKFAGIETDFNKLSERIGSNKALEQINKMKSYLNNLDQINVITNENDLKTVKSDSKGQYIEVYSKFLHDNFNLDKNTYYDQNYNGMLSNLTNRFFEVMGNQTYNMRKSKFIGNRTAFDKWQDSLVIPEFRDWDNINQSFIQPTGNLINGSLDQKFLALGTLKNASLTNDASTISALGLGYLGTNFLVGEQDTYYRQQSKINDLIQKQKYLEGKQTYYNINEYSTNTEIQKTLNKSEQKLFYNLINEVDDNRINYIHQHANAQLQRAMEIIENKKMNYLYNTNIRSQTIQEKDSPVLEQDFQTKYDYFYNSALAKKQLGLQLSLIEKRKLNYSYYNQLDLNANVSQEVLRDRLFGNGNYITSTIYNRNKSDYY